MKINFIYSTNNFYWWKFSNCSIDTRCPVAHLLLLILSVHCTIQFLRRKLVKMVEISAMFATHVRMDWGLVVVGEQFTMWMPTNARIVFKIVFSFTYCSVYSPEIRQLKIKQDKKSTKKVIKTWKKSRKKIAKKMKNLKKKIGEKSAKKRKN